MLFPRPFVPFLMTSAIRYRCLVELLTFADARLQTRVNKRSAVERLPSVPPAAFHRRGDLHETPRTVG